MNIYTVYTDTTVEASRGVPGLIQRNAEEGRWLLETPSEMLTKAALLLLLLSFLLLFLLYYPAAQVIWLGSHVVVFSRCGLQTVHVVHVR